MHGRAAGELSWQAVVLERSAAARFWSILPHVRHGSGPAPAEDLRPDSEAEAERRASAGQLERPTSLVLVRISGERASGRLYHTGRKGVPSIEAEHPPDALQLASIDRFLAEPWALPPSSIRCLEGSWCLELVELSTGETSLARFRCRGWRCPWCGPVEARILFARLAHALESGGDGAPPWVFVTLTFDPSALASQVAAYRASGLAQRRFLDRLRYRLSGRSRGDRRAPVQYVAVWERTRAGWPHAHLLIRSERLVDELGKPLGHWTNRVGERVPILEGAKGWVRESAVSAGFGRILDVQVARDGASMASYFSKLASEVAGVKAYQQPVNAPMNFRRVRPSRGLVPPRTRQGRLSGDLIFQTADRVQSARALC